MARKNENPKVPGCHGFAIFNERHEPHWTGKVELIPEMLDIPLRRRKPTTYFVNSTSDLFHESLPDEAIDRVFAVMALCPQHTFQVLTKRAERLREYWSSEIGVRSRMNQVLTIAAQCRGRGFESSEFFRLAYNPLPNVWLGVSVEDRERRERIEYLRATPAAVRFVSFEPLLEDLGPLDLSDIHLAIWGGESGPDARECRLLWIRRGMVYARYHRCRIFVKQLGSNVVDRNDAGFEGDTPTSWPMDTAWSELDTGYQGAPVRVLLDDRKGGDMHEWPRDLRVRQLPHGFDSQTHDASVERNAGDGL